ncbi:GNAT family N-acetyltransferase [Devosia sp. ZB163]|uniref:GNAT family N-acetyltransferase n=1 Tax=Devosia sp. ZB163 TaxID=3025938 RepID=UPI00236061EC|nr:GNAT family N-acetyltransferase [Devosia sp. ZB163]MDC9823487.1 GNAT family N-acetyltransferase [Devosia sp. ZB163]
MAATPEPQLVEAGPQHAEAIRTLVRAAYARWIPVIGREPRPMLADYDAALRRHRFDLLIADGRLLGLIETRLHDEHLWIENLAVAPEVQGRGHGRRLLAHAESLAARHGRTELRLLTNAAFESNVRLYHSVGYVTARSEPFMGGTTLHLSKRLPD